MIKVFPKNHDEQLTEHFWLREFHCKCTRPECDKTLVSLDLVEGLEEARSLVNAWIVINSAFRCPAHNADPIVDGEEKSFHLAGLAADIRASVSIEKLVHAVKRVECFRQGGIGLYRNRVHVDCRGVPARWIG